jgi:hypothetical protein
VLDSKTDVDNCVVLVVEEVVTLKVLDVLVAATILDSVIAFGVGVVGHMKIEGCVAAGVRIYPYLFFLEIQKYTINSLFITKHSFLSVQIPRIS